MRVDREAGVLAGEALFRARKAELVAHHVDEIGRVAAVEHAEALVEPDAVAVLPDQAIGDRMEGSGPGKLELAGDALRPARHLQRRATCEGEEQDALGRGAFDEQVRDAVRERVGLAGARARDDQ